MACPLCGEDCRCSYVPPPPRDDEDDVLELDGRTSVLIDPDSYEPTEEQFAASVYHEEAEIAPPAAAETGARPDSAPPSPPAERAEAGLLASMLPPRETTLTGIERLAHEVSSGAGLPGGFASGEGWRDEVHSRLNNYRARRRRVPEGAMPLDFGGGDEPAAAPVTRRSAALQRVASRYANRPPMMSSFDFAEDSPVEVEEPAENNVIEFPKPPAPPQPRSFEFERSAPLPLADELADAVQETPRILEAAAPEEIPPVMPPVTAITLEGEEEETAAPEALELPLRVAPIGPRVFAGMVDFSAVLVAGAVFAMVFVKITGGMPASKLAPVVGAGVVAILWGLYQYMFLVYAGTTPGLQVAGLALRDFSGEHMLRAARRNRAIGMIVAALPLGLGFIWAILDQDMLCWHDRMSHSYVVERGH